MIAMRPLLRGIFLFVLLAFVEEVRADWVVQVAALADSTFLRKMVVSIQKDGFAVTTDELPQKNGPTLTRLLSGPYETKAEAEAAAVRLAALGFPGYVKQRTQGRLPTTGPTPTPPPSKKPRAAAPTRRAAKPAATPASVVAAPIRSEPTLSPAPTPTSRPAPSLQPARPAEPPAPASAR